MEVLLVQNFTRRVSISVTHLTKVEGESFVGGLIIDQPTLEKVLNSIEDIEELKEVKKLVLFGPANILREVENHYSNTEGVDVKWQ